MPLIALRAPTRYVTISAPCGSGQRIFQALLEIESGCAPAVAWHVSGKNLEPEELRSQAVPTH
jgi:hypothetical protein